MSQSYPPPRPPISRTDLAGSIAALALTVVGGGAAAVLGVFMMAVTDYCPAAACAAGIGGYLFAVGG